MRLLFYIEPVVFRDNQNFLFTHVEWVARLIEGNSKKGVNFGFISSPHLCANLRQLLPDMAKVRYFELDPAILLKPFKFRRDYYSRALYGREAISGGKSDTAMLSSLVEILIAIKDEFSPNVVLGNAQNSAIEFAFRKTLSLFYEMAPLPRTGGKLNMFLDPSGHQVNSSLNTLLSEILAMPLSTDIQQETLAAWKKQIRATVLTQNSMPALSAFVQDKRKKRKVAILAMQPPDWLSYEGAFESISPDALLVKWAKSLPQGWVGIPTFHRDLQFPADLERSIAGDFSNIEFLPRHFSHNITELLIHLADGLITISSTAAMTACLHGIRTIVTGVCPFSKLLAARVEDIAITEPISESARASLIAFLTHRYCHEGKVFFEKENYLLSNIESMNSPEKAIETILDMRGWSPSCISRFV